MGGEIETHGMSSIADQDDFAAVPSWEGFVDVERPVGDRGSYAGLDDMQLAE